jgi:hypothetical protein
MIRYARREILNSLEHKVDTRNFLSARYKVNEKYQNDGVALADKHLLQLSRNDLILLIRMVTDNMSEEIVERSRFLLFATNGTFDVH